MTYQPGYTINWAYLDSIIGRSDIPRVQKRENAQQFASSLDRLSTQEVAQELSARTIEQNTVMMVTPRGTATGLLATTNGFFVSAYHAIEGLENKFAEDSVRKITRKNVQDFLEGGVGYFIIDQTGKYYSIDTSFLLADRKHDVALFKAIIPRCCEALSYNLSNRGVEREEVLTLLGMKQGLYKNEAIVKTQKPQALARCGALFIEDAFRAQGYVEEGFSGGPIVDQAGSLHGLISGHIDTKNDKREVLGIPSSFVTYLLGAGAMYFENKANGKRQRPKSGNNSKHL